MTAVRGERVRGWGRMKELRKQNKERHIHLNDSIVIDRKKGKGWRAGRIRWRGNGRRLDLGW